LEDLSLSNLGESRGFLLYSLFVKEETIVISTFPITDQSELKASPLSSLGIRTVRARGHEHVMRASDEAM